jgi:hypothetical protein
VTTTTERPRERPPEPEAATPTRSRFAFLRAHPRLLLYGSLIYLALIFSVMLWRGVSIEPQWVALALLVIAIAVGRGKQFIFDFTPFLLLFFAYEAMRTFAAASGAGHDISGLERALFLGRVPSETLQAAFYNAHQVGWLDVAAMVVYFMHFPLPVAAGFVFWLRSRELYWRYVASLLFLCFLAFLTYLFWPSTPPWLEPSTGVTHVTDVTVHRLFTNYFLSPIYHSFNPNRYAAFPSLHAAFPVIAAIYARWARMPKFALLLIGWTAAVWFSIVYLGEHYVVDALDGVVYTVVAIFVVERVWRVTRRCPSTEMSGEP